ncbi:delta 12 fatty acid desaturase [Obelidium mucronatum]|nr:delta 12 fatty acid desaturase [Obelidium mucronatum]
MAPEATTRQRRSSPVKGSQKTTFVSKRHPLTTSTPHYQNYEAPPFTLKELRDCVPPECFKHNTLLSLSYVALDVTMAAGLFYLATGIDNGWNGLVDTSSTAVRVALWFLYSVVQGWVCTGIWVLAHECGHGGFSANTTLNHVVGWILHSALLVPYFSWKITHSMHHKACGNMDKDQVFVPKVRSRKPERVRKEGEEIPEEHGQKEEEEGDMFELAPIVELFRVVRQQLFGWPAYILFNASGQKFKTWASHFHTSSPIFAPHQANQIIMSDIGLVIAFSVLGYFVHTYSFLTVLKFYIVPYLWVNHWLVMITFLQHTDVRLPHYRGAEWDFLKGALCTVDRDFGFLNYFFHHITDTHVAHHLFSNMPFYNAEVATAALKEKLGKHYHYDNNPIFWSLYNSYRSCKFVEDEGDIVFYKR